MNTTAIEGQEEPLTARWLRANTRIRGWFAFFMFALAIGGPLSVYNAVDASQKTSDYCGSSMLAMTDVSLGIIMLMVAFWAMIALWRRRPNAIFWAKFYTVMVFVTNCLSLCGEGMESQELSGAVRGIVWGLIWFCYLTFSSQVKEVFPKRYRHAGVCTWLCAGLLLLVPVICFIVGILDVAVNYHDNVEISQAELSDDELTDGHVVFDRLAGWSFGMEKSDGVNVCLFKNDQELVVSLASVLDSDDSKDNFVQTAAGAANADFEKLAHRIIRDDSNAVNGHTCHYRIVQYDQEDAAPVFWHFAGLFDRESGKAVVVNGYFPDKDFPDFTKLLRSIRFKK